MRDGGDNPFERDLGPTRANYVPLTPMSFLERAAAVYPDKVAVIHGEARYTYRDFHRRCHQLARALSARGIGRGDTVSVMAPNVPAMLEAHYGVPLCGAVLNALNYRLDADTIAFIMEHAGTRVLITDREFSDTIGKALARTKASPLVIDVDDALGEGGSALGEKDYEAFLAEGGQGDDSGAALPELADEWQAISLNYTSGTTGNPKGVVYHHRGAYLNAVGQILAFGLDARSIY
ncbi:MAG: AMP-binding protein, partial [Gammaproteobacteria bacterium]|nr:AMP-binding protein [Gammaproteobacteria bacterium]